MTRLVLVHGRDNQGLDAEQLDRTWTEVLDAGLAAAGSGVVVRDADTAFVYYGDTLAALVGGATTPPPVTVHAVGAARDGDALPSAAEAADEAAFVAAVAEEVLRAAGVTVPVRPEGAGPGGVEGDVGAWLNLLLSALDRSVPGLSGAVVALLARDVWAYLHDDAVRTTIDDALAAAIPTDGPAVVVAHSLGSVVAYAVLREHPDAARWDVPLLLTLGSPLAVRAIRDVLAARAPLRVPVPVRRWVAARDPRDALALHGLGPAAFPLDPASPGIEELVVANAAPGHHAAAVALDGARPAGYLAVPEVARTVADALDA
ncbi:hypothetical protein [Cellulosimicrobium cellulans]|uniref:hypothetical protein n=1 Tax=Cellulosimicrobium cellulans TaxID=1710 RepID=UPI001BAD401D|nr:hypothetical protein [Cellulosimicrobium cellulans]QUB99438.1 hypothetical protein J5A69_17370 [Cellulosimicrobium cellulans]